MPRISEFYGIVIYMYHDDHNPPHFHAEYAGQDVEVRISDGKIDGEFPVRASRFVRECWRITGPSWRRTGRSLGHLAASSGSHPCYDWTMKNRAVSARASGPATIEVRFADGARCSVDMTDRLERGIFAELHDDLLFRQVTIDEVGGAEWPNGASLSPEFLQALLAEPAAAVSDSPGR